jgi:hypothetical protein
MNPPAPTLLTHRPNPMNSNRVTRILTVLALSLVFAMPAIADPYALVRTITYNDPGVGWSAAGNDIWVMPALSDDYHLIVTGSRFPTGSAAREGTVFVFDAVNGSFLRRISSPDQFGGSAFASFVAVDGDLALIGAPDTLISQGVGGRAHLFNLATGTALFSFQESDGYLFNTEKFGTSAALEGGTCVIGAPTAGDGSLVPSQLSRGFAHVYDATTGQKTHTLSASDWELGGNFGWSVAKKGDRILVGAPFANRGAVSDAGKAYVFDAATGAELFILQSPDTPVTDDYFGFSVSVTDAYYVVVAPNDDDIVAASGSVYLFDRATGAFVRKITATPPRSGGAFGYNHSVSGEVMKVRQGLDGYGFYDLATGDRTELFQDVNVFGNSAWKGNVMIAARGSTTSQGHFDPAGATLTLHVLSNGALPPPASPPVLNYGGKRKINLKRPKLTLRGTASDLDGDLALIEVKVGNKPFTPASGTDSWSAPVKGLKPGKNTIQIRSKDAAGNTSATVKLTVVLK